MAVIRRKRRVHRPRRFGGLSDFKKAGWKVSRGRKGSKGGWTAAKRGAQVCATCTKSLMNRMMAKEAVGKWPK